MTRQRPDDAPVGPMSIKHKKATTAELTRLCLGGKPERPELVPTYSEICEFFSRSVR